MTEFTFTEEQAKFRDLVFEWLDEFPNTPRPFFVLEGYAGTGKSFSIDQVMMERELQCRYMTFTGKASLVLNKYHDLGSTTIHSAIYKMQDVPDEVFEELYQQIEDEPDNKENYEAEIQELLQPKFTLDPDAFEEDTPDVIILDECSMVNKEILDDLLSFGIPIIALGDPGQLPPVQGEGALFSGASDARLTEILRQALDSPIIQWSFWARTQRPLPSTDFDTWKEDKVSKIPKAFCTGKITVEMFKDHDVVICWKNKTRKAMNWWWRKQEGYKGTFPEVGERLIMTKNDRATNLVNGQMVDVVEVGELMDNHIELTVVQADKELGDRKIKLKVMRACFEEYVDQDAWAKVRPWDYKGNHQADYGYAITCHKAQGSQWERVLVFEENVFNWPKKYDLRAQWLYTAITRAIDKVTIVAGR